MTPTIEANRKHGKLKGVVIRTPYDPAFVDALKDRVPHHGRDWREGPRTWWIEAAYEDAVEKLILEYWPAVMRMGGKRDGHVVTRDGKTLIQGGLF